MTRADHRNAHLGTAELRVVFGGTFRSGFCNIEQGIILNSLEVRAIIPVTALTSTWLYLWVRPSPHKSDDVIQLQPINLAGETLLR